MAFFKDEIRAMSRIDDQLSSERPGAPALEKGLDILEALAEETGGLSQRMLAQRVGRSVGEIFRMLGVLERRGYIARDPQTGHYGLTLRLFELAHRHPPTRRLQAVALPVMEELVRSIKLSCHLVVVNGDRILVVGEVEPDLPMGWTVKLGATFPLSERYVSARILAAFQPPARRAEMARIMASQEGATRAETLLARLEGIAEAGHDIAPSEVFSGIMDLSFPILDHLGHAVAALTVVIVPQTGLTPEGEEIQRLHAEAALRISSAIGGSDASRS
jgi:DNA-binding IclR family transcriptional regulator